MDISLEGMRRKPARLKWSKMCTAYRLFFVFSPWGGVGAFILYFWPQGGGGGGGALNLVPRSQSVRGCPFRLTVGDLGTRLGGAYSSIYGTYFPTC